MNNKYFTEPKGPVAEKFKKKLWTAKRCNGVGFFLGEGLFVCLFGFLTEENRINFREHRRKPTAGRTGYKMCDGPCHWVSKYNDQRNSSLKLPSIYTTPYKFFEIYH